MRSGNSRIRLRPITMDDLSVCTQWVSDPEVVRHVIQETKTEEQEREWLENTLQNPHDTVFIIEMLDSGDPIGSCGIHKIATNPTLRDEEGVSIGIMLGDKAQWGKGYAAEAFSLLLQYIREHFDTRRVWLTVDTVHTRAIRAYEKIGFRIAREMEDPERIYSDGKQYVMEVFL